VLTGNPLREIFYEHPSSPVPADSQTLLVLGGSQGARAINEALMELAPRMLQKFPKMKIVHQTGKSDAPKVESLYQTLATGHLKAKPFIENMFEAYQSASLIICRAGALTVSEIIQCGRPAIFVPYPRRGQNDQTANAHLLEQAGGARVVEQGPQFSARLWQAFEDCFNSPKLQEMAEKTSRLRSRSSLATIGDQIQVALR